MGPVTLLGLSICLSAGFLTFKHTVGLHYGFMVAPFTHDRTYMDGAILA